MLIRLFACLYFKGVVKPGLHFKQSETNTLFLNQRRLKMIKKSLNKKQQQKIYIFIFLFVLIHFFSLKKQDSQLISKTYIIYKDEGLEGLVMLRTTAVYSGLICIQNAHFIVKMWPPETKLLWKHPLVSHFASVYLVVSFWPGTFFPPNLCVWQYVCACNFLFFPLFCVCDGNFVCFLKSLHSIVWDCLAFSCGFVNVCVF